MRILYRSDKCKRHSRKVARKSLKKRQKRKRVLKALRSNSKSN